MDPYEKFDMIFNGRSDPRLYQLSGHTRARTRLDGCALFRSAYRVRQVGHEVSEHQTIPGGCSDDLIPNLQNPAKPFPRAGS